MVQYQEDDEEEEMFNPYDYNACQSEDDESRPLVMPQSRQQLSASQQRNGHVF